MTIKRPCEHCHKPVKFSREHGRFCSERCRQRAYREKKKGAAA